MEGDDAQQPQEQGGDFPEQQQPPGEEEQAEGAVGDEDLKEETDPGGDAVAALPDGSPGEGDPAAAEHQDEAAGEAP